MAGPTLNLFACLFVTSLYSYALIRPSKLLFSRCLLASPVIALYLWLPFSLYGVKTAVLPTALVACIIGWLASFKLIMLAFGRGPLVDPKVDQSLLRFCAVLCCPIHLKPSTGKGPEKKKEGALTLLGQSLLKIGIMLVLLRVGDTWQGVNTPVYHFFWYFNLYLFISVVMNLSGAFAAWLLGVELLPDFDRPFLSTSVSNFWSHRWNLTVSALLRESVYEPLLEKLGERRRAMLQATRGGAPNDGSRAKDKLKAEPVEKLRFHTSEERLGAMLASFVVSGLAHELIFWYITRTATGEVTAFFVVHGVAVAVERWVRRSHPKAFQFPRPVKILLTLAFCFVTAEWLFLATLARTGNDIRVMSEVKRALSFGFDQKALQGPRGYGWQVISAQGNLTSIDGPPSSHCLWSGLCWGSLTS